jgi:hypothetical protein
MELNISKANRGGVVRNIVMNIYGLNSNHILDHKGLLSLKYRLKFKGGKVCVCDNKSVRKA